MSDGWDDTEGRRITTRRHPAPPLAEGDGNENPLTTQRTLDRVYVQSRGAEQGFDSSTTMIVGDVHLRGRASIIRYPLWELARNRSRCGASIAEVPGRGGSDRARFVGTVFVSQPLLSGQSQSTPVFSGPRPHFALRNSVRQYLPYEHVFRHTQARVEGPAAWRASHAQ